MHFRLNQFGLLHIFNGFGSCQLHGNGKFFIEVVEYRFYSFRSAQIETVNDRSANGYQIGTAGQSFEYVITSSYSAVENDGSSLINCFGNRRKYGKGGRASVKLAATVIGDPDAICTGIQSD